MNGNYNYRANALLEERKHENFTIITHSIGIIMIFQQLFGF